LPAELGNELQINPFLRTRNPSVINAVKKMAPPGTNKEAEIFAQLRIWKNEYK
jgi:hydroxyacylglutathione hydrolase